MTQHTKLAAGNWKMNGVWTGLHEVATLLDLHPDPACEILMCPPATLLSRMSDMTVDGAIITGGQDCHASEAGAHTGDTSANMLADAGAEYVILGHSERRADHDEKDEDVRVKALCGLAEGLSVIICVGESLAQREAGQTLDIIGAQMVGSIPDTVNDETLVVAYEPIWAIGTGKVPSLEQIREVHDFVRARLQHRLGDDVGGSVRILYGGSVNASNAAEIFAVANVDGALVGGASLKAADFSPIIKALENSV